MSRAAVVGVLLGCLALGGCSRREPSDEQRDSNSAAPGPTPAPAPPAPPGSVTEPSDDVLTPEDIEPEAERRITEQNLESELDRLEREIQGP